MALDEVNVAPTIESFKPLSEHEAQTPSTFFGGPPVLHLFSPKATILVSKTQLNETPVLKRLRAEAVVAEGQQDGAEAQDEDVAIENVDVWVTSRSLILFATGQKGVSISYPSIALHAMGTRESKHLPDGAASVVFLQINIHDPETTNSDDEIHTLDLSICATEVAVGSAAATSAPLTEGEQTDAPPKPVKALFEALSACADLHPDPNEDSDEAGELDAEPGAGGWITAENMNDFVDEDGNFIAPAALGPGAGTVRGREDEDEDQVNGGEEDESKWQRTT